MTDTLKSARPGEAHGAWIPFAAFEMLRLRATSQDAPKPDPEHPDDPDDIPDTPPTEPPPVPIRDPRPDTSPPGPYVTRSHRAKRVLA